MLLPIVVDLIGQRLAHKRGKSSKTVDPQGSICEERQDARFENTDSFCSDRLVPTFGGS